MKILLLTSLCSLLACTGNKTDGNGGDEVTSDQDGDGDGFSIADGDCDDANNIVHPDAEDTWYDGADTNCDGADDYDRDGDGYVPDEYEDESTLPAGDCWDDVSDVAAEFVAINGFDQPTADMVHPDAEEVYYDGVDSNCDERNDFDQDLDGDESDHYPDRDGEFGTDCVDNAEDAENHEGGIGDFLPNQINSYMSELYYDGYDQNCNPDDEYDADGDGRDSDQYDGDDCDDSDAEVHPGAGEIENDGVDQNCDDQELCPEDGDGDGFGSSTNTEFSPDLSCEGAGVANNADDCNDAEATIYPGAAEETGSVDRNCDGMEAGGHLACSGAAFTNASNEDVYFLYCGESVTQPEAQLTCQNYGYALATVKDETENNELSSYYNWIYSAWIDLTDFADEGVFVWGDGSSPSFTNWGGGGVIPENADEDCVSVTGSANATTGIWWDRDCSTDNAFVCESR